MTSRSPGRLDRLGPKERAEVLAHVAAFEELWQCGERPAIVDHLPDNPATRKAALVELVQIDWRRRINAGEQAEVERYLDEFPELADERDRLRELIGTDRPLHESARSAALIDEDEKRLAENASRCRIDADTGFNTPSQSESDTSEGRSHAESDRNLLFGILALQMDFISRESLIAAMNAWVLQKARPLGEILIEQKALTVEDHAALAGVVARHLQRHQDDPQQSLATLRISPAAQQELDRFADPDLQRSIVQVGSRPLRPSDTSAWTDRRKADGIEERFDILRRHAWGGLGEIYVAQDRELDREVALKRLHERYAEDEEIRARFLQEAKVTGGLEHPGIVPVYGLGSSANGRLFYAMRFVRGETLREAIDRFHSREQSSESERRIELRQLLTRFIAVCNAIEYAHNRGVIHRDLKPSNIMLGKYGETLVVDWGLAKALGRRGENAVFDEHTLVPASGSDSAETLPGSAIGTPSYMSPEQSEGRIHEVGPASDIYSLGATLYMLLTGKEAFKSSVLGVVLKKVQSGDFVPPRDQNPAVPRALDAICLKAMSLLPGDRYQSCAELALDIERWLADEPVSALKDPTSDRLIRWIRRHRVAAAACAALLAAALVSLVAGTVLLGRANARITAQSHETERERKAADLQRTIAETEKRHADAQASLAERRRKEAESARSTIETYLARSEYNLYLASLGDAERERSDSQPARAERALERCPPRFREWEWYYLKALCHPELLTLTGHTGAVDSVAVDPRGARAASGSSDRSIILWDLKSGQKVLSLHAAGAVYGVAFRPSGNELASAQEGGTIALWNAADGRPIWTHRGHSKDVLSVAFDPEGQLLVSGSADRTVKVWKADSGSEVRTLRGHEAEVTCVTFSPDGKRIASASRDKTVKIWDASTGRELHTLGPIAYWVNAIAYSADGKLLATGGHDQRIRLWDADTGVEKPVSFRHSNGIRGLAFSREGILASASEDRNVRTWDFRRPIDGQYVYRGHADEVYSVAFSPDATRMVSGGADKTVKVWDATQPPDHLYFWTQKGNTFSVGFSPDGRWLAAGIGEIEDPWKNGELRIFDLRQKKPAFTLRGKGGAVSAVCYSPDGKRLAYSDAKGTIRILKTSDRSEALTLTGHTRTILCMRYSPDGTRLASSDGSFIAPFTPGEVRLWDPRSGKQTAVLRGHLGGVTAVAFSPDGRRLASGAFDRIIKIWDPATGRELMTLKGHARELSCLAFSPAGTWLASGSGNPFNVAAGGELKVWDVNTGKEIATYRGITHRINSLVYLSDGRRLASCSTDARIRFWDTRTREQVFSLSPSTNYPMSLAVSADGRRLACGNYSSSAEVFEAAGTGQ